MPTREQQPDQPRPMYEAFKKAEAEHREKERLQNEALTFGVIKDLDPTFLYACWDCHYPWLTVDTLAWRLGSVPMGGGVTLFCYRVTCLDKRDCWRRAEFMGTATWRTK